ncbi:hypothetical protein ABIA30_001255 [Mycobacterium sp. MAA66]
MARSAIGVRDNHQQIDDFCFRVPATAGRTVALS